MSNPVILPLYPDAPAVPIETVPPLALDHGCDRCALRKQGGRTVCLPDEGEPGGLLVVGEGPGRQEDAAGRPFVGASGAVIRRAVEAHWKGPVAYANATRCFPGQAGVTAAAVEACRPYLAATVREGFDRIVVLGGWAGYSLLGRNTPVMSLRRAYGFLSDGTPVFIVMHPAAALRNRFVMQWFQADIAWALTCPKPFPSWDGTVRLVTTPEEAAQAVAELREGRWFSFDTETAGTMHESDFQLLSLAACAAGAEDAWAWDREALKNPSLADPLRRLLADPHAYKVGHNIKFDISAVALGLGIEIPAASVYADTRLWRRLIDPEAAGDLATMAELVGHGGHKSENNLYRDLGIKQARSLIAAEDKLLHSEVKPHLAKKYREIVTQASQEVRNVAKALRAGKSAMAYAYQCVPRDVLLRYNGLDAVTTARLAELMERQLARAPYQLAIWEKLLKRASVAFSKMERWGIAGDRAACRLFGDHLRGRLKGIRDSLRGYGLADPSSPDKVADFLFRRLGLGSVKKTKSGKKDSTDAEVLEALRGQHPAVDILLEDRRLSKLLGTYADGWDGKSGQIQHILEDGRIHPTFNLDGARTGRLSCENPNGQNIPRPETIEGRMARNVFTARPGYLILSADYSQLELRVAAMLSKDPVMIKLFNSDVDFHEGTARLIAPIAFGVADWDALDQETRKKYRSYSKAVNFGLAYGMSDETLAAMLGCSVAKARQIREAILGTFQEFTALSEECKRQARRTGAIWTWWDGQPGRCRPLTQIADQEPSRRLHAENSAVNTPVQGTASEFCLASVVAAVEWVEEEGITDLCRPILTVHDSIMFEVREDFVDEAAYHVRRLMLQWNSGDVPLDVDIEVGPAWGSLSKWPPKEV